MLGDNEIQDGILMAIVLEAVVGVEDKNHKIASETRSLVKRARLWECKLQTLVDKTDEQLGPSPRMGGRFRKVVRIGGGTATTAVNHKSNRSVLLAATSVNVRTGVPDDYDVPAPRKRLPIDVPFFPAGDRAWPTNLQSVQRYAIG